MRKPATETPSRSARRANTGQAIAERHVIEGRERLLATPDLPL